MGVIYFNEKTKNQQALVVSVNVKPHRQGEFFDLLKDLVKSSKKDEGCLSYNIYQDIEKPSNYLFHEVWANKEALAAHQKSPHFKYFSAKKDSMILGGMKVDRFERSEARMPKSSEGSFVLFARIKALQGKENELHKVLESLITPTMAEPGAEHYELHRHNQERNKFLFHETWTTVPHWDDHMKTKHLVDFLKIIDNYVDGGIVVTKTKQVL